jgi:hypothetical protein
MYSQGFFEDIVIGLLLYGTVVGVAAVGVVYGLYTLCQHITISWN